jgi:sigma-E factor negative regulatory protein RseA
MNERISTLVDGELGDGEARSVIDALESDAGARDTWRTYHLISDAMRDTRVLSPGFAERVAARLDAEPTVLAPRRLKPQARPWYAIPAAAAAGVAGVSLVGYLAFAPRPDMPAIAQAPQAPVTAPAPAPQPQVAIVPLPSGTPDYLLAHQGFSSRVSLQGMAPYARTVSAQANEGRR